MNIYPCKDCGADEPKRQSLPDRVEELICSNPDCDNKVSHVIHDEDEYEILECKWNVENFKPKSVEKEKDREPLDGRRVVCMAALCTLHNICKIAIPDDPGKRQSFFKPGEHVHIRKFEQNDDGTCDHLVK